jgi:hypothetical protein
MQKLQAVCIHTSSIKTMKQEKPNHGLLPIAASAAQAEA